jgi:hypothetical protein
MSTTVERHMRTSLSHSDSQSQITSTQMMLNENRVWLESLALLSTLLGLIVTTSIVLHEMKAENESHTKMENVAEATLPFVKECDNENLSTTCRFPWEPVSNNVSAPLIDTERHTKRDSNSGISDIIIDNNDSMLRLLAGMTFANGGLRAPSCLCCQ